MKIIVYEVHDKRGSATHPWSISSHEKKYKIDPKTKKVVSTWTNEKSHIDNKNYSNQKAATTAAKKLKQLREKQINEGAISKEKIEGVVRNSDGTIKEWF